MEMNAFQALALLRRTLPIPRQQARQMYSLLRTLRDSQGQEVLVPRSLTGLCDLIWLAQVTPPSTRRH